MGLKSGSHGLLIVCALELTLPSLSRRLLLNLDSLNSNVKVNVTYQGAVKDKVK